MAGLGRRSHYRKHLTDTVLNEYPEPNKSKGEYVAQVASSRGGNLFDLIIAAPTNQEEGIEGTSQIAMLPTKYRKLVWIKRGDYVIVESGTQTQQSSQSTPEEEDTEVEDLDDSSDNKINSNSSGIRYLIKHILYKKQIIHLKQCKLWPKIFTKDDDDDDEEGQKRNTVEKDEDIIAKAKLIAIKKKKEKEENYDDDDDEYYTSEEEDNDDDLFLVNTNRLATMKIDDSSSDDDDSY